MFKLIRWILSIVGILLLLVIGYVVFVALNYSRIEDNQVLSIESLTSTTANKDVELGKDYSLVTYNLGFGAYDPNYSFFMDKSTLRKDVESVGKAGETVTGKASTASSKESAEVLTNGALNTLDFISPDFIYFQEIDKDSNRSKRVNQVEEAKLAFPEMSSIFASNFHSVWLQYPPLDPIGDIQSGIQTFSSFRIASAVRRSLPITDAFPTKFFDLDRCLMVLHLPVKDSSKQLVMINLHLSAYDKDGEFKKEQLTLLYELAKAEASKGNFVIIGGDFNNAFGSSITDFQNSEEIPEWIIDFDKTKVPSGFSIVTPSNSKELGSVRDTSFPYLPGQNYETITDGFIVSDNVEANSKILDTKYKYSDHNPVKLDFKLKL
jgi:endonuclease/exonuclease/phosphatase family metal-dependent hydrolase